MHQSDTSNAILMRLLLFLDPSWRIVHEKKAAMLSEICFCQMALILHGSMPSFAPRGTKTVTNGAKVPRLCSVRQAIDSDTSHVTLCVHMVGVALLSFATRGNANQHAVASPPPAKVSLLCASTALRCCARSRVATHMRAAR